MGAFAHAPKHKSTNLIFKSTSRQPSLVVQKAIVKNDATINYDME